MTNRTRYVAGRTSWATGPHGAKQERNNALREVTQTNAVVYAMRRGDGTIKIGWTANLARRAKEHGGEVLAYKYGDMADEKALHKELAGHRAHGREYYYPTPVVLAVINDMRSELGIKPLAS